MVGTIATEAAQLKARLKGTGMVNRVLQNICTAEGISRAGVKAELQNRLGDRLDLHRQNDPAAYARLKTMIEQPDTITIPGSPHPAAMTATSTVPSAGPVYGGYHAGRPPMHGPGHLDFKPSPFYQFREQIGSTQVLDVMASHRHAAVCPVRVEDLTQVASDPSLRVMVFCAGDNRGRQDIAFPHQSEIKVNGGEVKANLRGLKNKPGSTRPVDITKELRFTGPPKYANNVELTYALTSKKFHVAIYIMRLVPIEDLVQKLDLGRRIAKETILNDMANKARDADIVATASISCRHNQCFDATSYLQLQEQGPTWLCPICNNPAPFENLAVDEYVKDILKRTSRSVDQVTVQPSGKWELHTRSDSTTKQNGVASSDDDDELVEITKTGNSIQMGTPRPYSTPVSAAPVAPSNLRDVSASSTTARSQASSSTKRPAAVIDLTSSGDEDDEPLARQPKRRLTSNGTNGFSSSTPLYRVGGPTPNGYPRI